MKTCSYCGKQYPDEITNCPVDGEPLPELYSERRKVTGVWRGVYGYDNEKALTGEGVAFTLKLKQGWLGHFTGTIVEDAPMGVPETGSIEGFFGLPRIEFTTCMPVGYLRNPDGSKITLREYFGTQGRVCPDELPGPPIRYEGRFLDENRIQGTWVIMPRSIKLPDGWSVNMGQNTGIWCAEFVSANLDATPSGGPKEPFFDRDLLPERSGAQPEDVSYCRLGKFIVADAEKFLPQFEDEGIRFEINQDDSAMREMMPIAAVTGGYGGTAPMIEVFVHPDDESKAAAIVSADNHL